MKRILEMITQPGRGELSALAGKLRGLLFLGCLLVAGQALASVTYRMVGGVCTDSNHGETFYPNDIDGGMFGPGPKLCSDTITAEINMADGYVPGTRFEDNDYLGQDPHIDVLSFSVSDGARSLTIGYPRNSWDHIQGALPETTALAEFDAVGNYIFRTRLDGTWEFSLEFGAHEGYGVPGYCGIGSIEGPNNGIDGYCAPSGGHYFAIGTYEGWYRVPEPPTLALVLAFAIMAGLHCRRRRGPVIRG